MALQTYDIKNILENFEFLGHKPSESVLNKCLALCNKYAINEEDFVDMWAAFAITHLKGAAPCIESLQSFERRELSKPVQKATDILHHPLPLLPSQSVAPSTPKAVNKIPILSDEISLSPSVSQAIQYSSREHAGKVILSHGTNKNYVCCMQAVAVKQHSDSGELLTSDVRYMYESMGRKVTSLASITTSVANCIFKQHNLQMPERYIRDGQGDEFLYGRIICDSEGKLNKASVMLELPRGSFSPGDAIPMNLTQMPSYSLYPGQIVVTEGLIVRGQINVAKIYPGVDEIPRQKPVLKENLQIMTACGPYTLNNNLLYEPLQDLLKVVLEKLPHVLILTGPFMDVDHDLIANGFTEDYEKFFNSLVESIMLPLAGTKTTVVFVASHKDVFHHVVYPTPPFELKHQYSNMICVPDPCVLDIEGVLVGITTADIVFHIAKQDLCWPSGLSDRMSRICRHVLSQQHFYPLYPPDKTMSVDHELLERFGMFEKVPHVMILPSCFKHFIKNVNGCTVVNPEKLVKGMSGGTYARLNISTKDTTCEIIQI
ncbi:PREDICTED: DNA polymerase alpha subunit B [Nicrophorus vespilloides]|uniref:DNA polymerase alpha subunit B n=1 Tax=Nicrophorus vespilloides TaxID=110193 RepID=A0ABM1NEN4_NICVS|nr:PREDICTED: DNA polymerase alpha subunit B [Nicrophorus vespilloides]